MARLGVRVTLIHPGRRIGPEWRDPAIREVRLPYPRIRGGWRLFERLAARTACRLASTPTHDLIYMRVSPSSVISGSLAKIALPKLLELNGSEVISDPKFRALSTSVDMIMVDSEQMADLVRGVLPAAASKIRVHSSVGVDTAHFRPMIKSECRRALQIPEAKKVLLHVSGFQPHHDFMTILQAMEILSRRDSAYCLILLGDGPGWRDVRDRVSGLRCSAQIVMPGLKPLSELPAHISAADVCLNVITARVLAEGNFRATKLFEYMACERPVISTVLEDGIVPDWAKELLTLIPCEDPASLANAAEEVLDRGQWLDCRVASGRQWVEANLSWTATTGSTLAHLRSLHQKT